jgi:hypothetical protein
MEPRSKNPALLAPGAAASAPLRCPPAERPWPRLDDHLVQPEVSRFEIVQGHQIEAMGANAEHADPHCQMDAVIWNHVAPGYVASTDLLTRFTESSDFAPDTCVRRTGKDPQTGTIYLEELCFEVVNESHLRGPRSPTAKAEEMTVRGVRRVFGIFVKTGEVREWRGGEWQLLPPDASISDPCFVRPLPVRALVDAAAADDAVAQALLARGNRVLVQQIRQEGVRQAIVDLCELLGIPLDTGRQDRLQRADLPELEALRDGLKRTRSWPSG